MHVTNKKPKCFVRREHSRRGPRWAGPGPRTNLGYDRIAGFEFRSSGGEEKKAARGRHKFTPAATATADAVADLSPSLSSSRQASGEIVAVQRRPFHASHGDGGDERKGADGRTDGRARRRLSLSSAGPLCCAQSTFQAI